MRDSDFPNDSEGSEIAIIGMALRLPGARTPQALWHNLKEGVESVVFLSDEELLAAGVKPALLQEPDYVRACVPLDDFDKFDAAFFGFSPRDAAIMDPQHRIFLECAWEAVENAGYDPERYDGAIGVYGGCGMNAYMMYNLLSNPALMASAGEFLIRHTGNDKDFLTTRVSYNLNLRGPSVNVQTACSTSLVAVHLACQSLLNVECDIALAGGVTINLPNRVGYLYRSGEVASPDGHCRAFDKDAQGTLFASGAAIVVLKRLNDAIRDGDTIHALIKGSAINNDGSMKVGYLAPSVEGQAKAIAEAIAVSGVDAESITYVEAHGTGTAIGDPIEIAALTQAFRTDTEKKQYCAIGSLKTNIGHLDTAAGIAGLIKTTLALKHKAIPASLHFKQPNPRIDFADSPFYVCSAYQPWKSEGAPRRAGVSSLGVGGTNAHVILEEAPLPKSSGVSRPYQLLLLSAKTESALAAMTLGLADHFSQPEEITLADAAYTLQTGRRTFEYRRALVCGNLKGAVEGLTEGNPKQPYTGKAKTDNPHVVFMFPGGGAQYPNMGLELYRNEPVYREAANNCFALLRSQLDYDLKALMFPRQEQTVAAGEQLERPLNSVLSVFITEYALAQLWMAWGVKPAAMTGHSLGEYTAACLAGVMSLEDALAMVTFRGKLFEQMPEGAMLSVPLPEAEVGYLLNDGLSLAAVNSPGLTVVSGKPENLRQLEARLATMDVECSRVKISVAAHSAMLDPFLEGFSRKVSTIRLQRPAIPFVSNTTGDWIRDADAMDSGYWVRQLRQTVRFADGIQKLEEQVNSVYIEVGPGTTLSSFIRQQPGVAPRTVVSSLPHANEALSSQQFMLTSLGRLWIAGQQVDWGGFYKGESRRRIPLPAYPFERQRYWIEPGILAAAPERKPLTRTLKFADWFYRPLWKQQELVAATPENRLCWLLFTDRSTFSAKLRRRLEKLGHEVIVVNPGDSFQVSGEGYCINPASRKDFDALIGGLAERGKLPQRILTLWHTGEVKGVPKGVPKGVIEEKPQQYFYSLLYLAQALGEQELARTVHLSVISTGLQRVKAEPLNSPLKALLLGPCRVIPQEYAQISCASIDIELPQGRFGFNRQAQERILEQLIAEAVAAPQAEEVIALRRDGRWVQQFVAAEMSGSHDRQPVIKEQGVYFITGGLGGIGLVIADMLVQEARANLVLLSRQGLPDRDQWARWLEMYDDQDQTCQRIRAVQKLEEAGSQVYIAQADVADFEQMGKVLAEAQSRFGRINGVIHAAGVTDDELIQFKTGEAAQRVIDPKVKGALVIDELLKDADLDFLLLLSSTSSLIGWQGQVDYAAANAFLDAFAQSRASGKCFTAAVNLGIWQKVGMAARAASQRLARKPQSDRSQSAHPLLGSVVSESPDHIVCEQVLSAAEQWVLSEHRVKAGDCVLPGTAYIELARAALERLTGAFFIVLSELLFVSPMVLAEDEKREVRVSLRKKENHYAFAVASRAIGNGGWQEHVQATLQCPDPEASAAYPIKAVLERCGTRENCKGIERQETYLHFGPRWKNYGQIYRGSQEAVALLELDEQFRDDLEVFRLHPALLDIATGFALSLIPDFDQYEGVYVPASYGRLTIHNALTARVYSHAICRRESDARKGVAAFDVTLTDEAGNLLVEIDELIVRRISSDKDWTARQSVGSAGSRLIGSKTLAEDSALHLIGQGILPEEGAQAIRQILQTRMAPQIVVSSLNLQALSEQARAARPQPEAFAALPLERPEIASSYAPARNDMEKFLVKLWQELLGIERVGIHDDFFDLGGHSLMAVRMFAKIKKAYKADLGLAPLLAAPTIAQLAQLMGGEKVLPEFTSVVPIQPQGSRPPLFCIHGVGGNIVEYSHLAKHLSGEQPFYGIQAASLNKKGPQGQQSIEEMAASYIKEVRLLQPEGPYYFAGSSLGGVIGYEMAQQLHELGQQVALLALFDTYGLDYPKLLPTTTVVQEKIARLRFRVHLHWSNFSMLGGKERLAYLREKSRKAKVKLIRSSLDFTHGFRKRLNHLLLPEVVGLTRFKAVSHFRNSLKRVLLPDEIRAAQRVVGHASLNYELTPYRNTGKVVLFRATEQPSGIYPDALNGWGGLIAQLDIYDVSGHHGAIIREPKVQALVELLHQCLDEVQASQSKGTKALTRVSPPKKFSESVPH
jgi:acyl transferase domain-containing protein/thioesterase domain-containing protein